MWMPAKQKMNDDKKSKNVCVVVLGDIGRSPRMQYHSLSLAEMGHKVDIIGYGETEPLDSIKNAPLLYYHYLMPYPNIPQRYLNYLVKTVWQALNLLFLLAVGRKPDVLIVQNPPAIPALIICWVFCRIIGAKFVIDWHNYAHTIMALNLSENHKLVKITKRVETFIGQKADANFCVTNAMKDDLNKKYNIQAITLYDKPPIIFKSITLEEKHDFLCKMAKKYKNIFSENGTKFTEVLSDQIALKCPRPGIIVSSTSWTEDEDFSVLFKTLQDYENHIANGNTRNLPDLFCFITGKGHLKEYYCKKILEQNWEHVFVTTPWLEPEDYPLMLASADLGVCLHTSSSGLDLPMKVVDMFGCALPVCAYKFKCLNELVQHEQNGFQFSSSEELLEQILNWFENFPNNEQQKQLEKRFKSALQQFQNVRWQENWNRIAKPIFM